MVKTKKPTPWTVFHPSKQKWVQLLLVVEAGKERDYVQAAAEKAYLLTGKITTDTVQRMLDIETLK